MIDTDKYEGHTEGPWDDFGIPLYDLSLKIIDEEIQIEEDGVYRWEIPQDSGRAEMTDWTRYTWEEVKEIDANKALITDAPLLLQEFKRLREENDELRAQRVKSFWIQEPRGGLSDRPLLLAEVKRLREQFKLAYDWVDMQFPDGGMADFAKYIGD